MTYYVLAIPSLEAIRTFKRQPVADVVFSGTMDQCTSWCHENADAARYRFDVQLSVVSVDHLEFFREKVAKTLQGVNGG